MAERKGFHLYRYRQKSTNIYMQTNPYVIAFYDIFAKSQTRKKIVILTLSGQIRGRKNKKAGITPRPINTDF